MEHTSDVQAPERVLSNKPHAIYMRQHRKPYRELSLDERSRDACRSYTEMLVKRGVLKMGTECEWCGNQQELERHHPDYSNPRLFETICKPCHRFYHRTLKKMEVS